MTRVTPKHITEKFQNVRGKEKILKGFRKKLWRKTILDFSTTLEAIKPWSNASEFWGKSHFQPNISIPQVSTKCNVSYRNSGGCTPPKQEITERKRGGKMGSEK